LRAASATRSTQALVMLLLSASFCASALASLVLAVGSSSGAPPAAAPPTVNEALASWVLASGCTAASELLESVTDFSVCPAAAAAKAPAATAATTTRPRRAEDGGDSRCEPRTRTTAPSSAFSSAGEGAWPPGERCEAKTGPSVFGESDQEPGRGIPVNKPFGVVRSVLLFVI
jgi:hypothetical protein